MISRRKFLLYILSAIGFSFFGYGIYEKGKYKIEKLNLPKKNWIGAPLKIVFLTDIHRGPFTTKYFLEKISNEIEKIEVDIILFGGDYIYSSIKYLKDSLSSFKKLNPKLGKWGVLGNHDNFLGRKEVIKYLKENDVNLLNNNSIKLISGENTLSLFGVDDFKTGHPNLISALKFIKKDELTIGISHNPILWVKTKTNFQADLLLSGHTHGGQIDIPLIGPPFLLPGHGREFYRGLYNLNGMKLYVSRGIGTIHIPLRLFCPPEITTINIFNKN